MVQKGMASAPPIERVATSHPETDEEPVICFSTLLNKIKISPSEGNADFGLQIFTELALDLELSC